QGRTVLGMHAPFQTGIASVEFPGREPEEALLLSVPGDSSGEKIPIERSNPTRIHREFQPALIHSAGRRGRVPGFGTDPDRIPHESVALDFEGADGDFDWKDRTVLATAVDVEGGRHRLRHVTRAAAGQPTGITAGEDLRH